MKKANIELPTADAALLSSALEFLPVTFKPTTYLIFVYIYYVNSEMQHSSCKYSSLFSKTLEHVNKKELDILDIPSFSPKHPSCFLVVLVHYRVTSSAVHFFPQEECYPCRLFSLTILHYLHSHSIAYTSLIRYSHDALHCPHRNRLLSTLFAFCLEIQQHTFLKILLAFMMWSCTVSCTHISLDCSKRDTPHSCHCYSV